MQSGPRLCDYLERYAETDLRAYAVADAVDAIAAASRDIAKLTSRGLLATPGGGGARNPDGDIQQPLDLLADQLVRSATRNVPMSAFVSEELEISEIRDPLAPICLAVDPLDGSSNLETNVTVGTIFSIRPTPAAGEGYFREAGTAQIAAGFFVYGPQTSLVLTLGEGVDVFTLDPAEDVYRLVRSNVRIPVDACEYAINASNHRHWGTPVRTYIEECLAGAAGPEARNYNMRWIGSLVAETYRILMRGGIFLYPSDARAGYAEGRLRLVYEAHPMAFIIEQAGGAATTGRERIQALAAASLHQRVPLIMGSSSEVERVEQLHRSDGQVTHASAPLFSSRGLFRV